MKYDLADIFSKYIVKLKYEDLEDNFKNYITFIEDSVGVKIKLISLGPDREETVLLD